MNKWLWTLKNYYTPENADKKPLKEKWIFHYSKKDSGIINNDSMTNPEEQKEQN